MGTFGRCDEGCGDNISGRCIVFNCSQGILFVWLFIYFIVVLFLAVVSAEGY